MDAIVLIGRILYGGILVILGFNNYIKLKKKTELAKSKGVPFPRQSVIFSTALITLGGLSILLNYQIGIGVLFVWIFLIPTTIMVHNFWTLEDPIAKEIDMLHFLKNIALLGAALIFLGLPHSN